MFDEYKDILTVNELMAALRISKPYAYKLLNSKSISALRIGKQWRIPKTSLIEFVRKEGA